MHTQDFWTSIGISWEKCDLADQTGEHATDRKAVGYAYILVPQDFDLVREHFGDERMRSGLNGTSWRVKIQNAIRPLLAKGAHISDDELKERAYNAIMGIRSRAASVRIETVTITRHALPDGTFYSGSDITEYRQLYVAALVDLGTPASIATNVAQNITL